MTAALVTRRCLYVRAGLVKPQKPTQDVRGMANSTKIKDRKSAICVIPPRHLWDAIQDIRLFNDKGFVRCARCSTEVHEYESIIVAVCHASLCVLMLFCCVGGHPT